MRIIRKLKKIIKPTSKPDSLLSSLQNQFGLLDKQKEFSELLWFALRGLNIGTGDMYESSGELTFLKKIKTGLFSSNTKTPWIIFDVGANLGGYALEIKKIFEDNAIIHVFEPSLKTFNLLRENLNGKSGFVLVNKGVSSKTGSDILYTDADGSGMASLTKRGLSYRNINMDKEEEVKLTTIDQYCKDNEIEHIHFLKLDIEGFELEALKGATNMMSGGNIDCIQFEFGGCNIDTRTFFKDFYFLLQEHYNIYRLLQDNIIHIPEYHEINEQFDTTNYIAISKRSVWL